MRVLVVIGTRPEVIKMAPVIREMARRSGSIRADICATAQHREMLDQTLRVFDINADIDLDLMEVGQNPSQVAARVLLALDPVLAELQPDWLLVQGDTTTVMAASVAAFHRGTRVAHVEAGLRTHDRFKPFPEELNRVIADQVGSLHFAPTSRAKENLIGEGIPADSIHVTGNTVVDALFWAADQPLSDLTRETFKRLGLDGARPRKIVLVTAHRRENAGLPLARICSGLRELTHRWPECQVVFPVHPNPDVKRLVHESLGDHGGVTLLQPVDYLTLVQLMKRSFLVLTDSGGIQEEAVTLGVPVLVLREATDRPEAIDAGTAVLVGTSPRRILEEVQRRMNKRPSSAQVRSLVQTYGDGQAARRIVEILLSTAVDDREIGEKALSPLPSVSSEG